ncbi:50S ribosomal protein L28 [Patescibacteria group bacterium]|nr:50S ribosomal protein L28 [Patescibacteria group bacterium]
MAKICYKCGRTAMAGNNVSHSNIKTKRRFNLNLQKKRIVESGVSKKVNMCTKCIKSMSKVK